MGALSARAGVASPPVYIVSALPPYSTYNAVQTFVISQDDCDFVEMHFTQGGTTKDNYRCHLQSGSDALLVGRGGKFTVSLETPQGAEIHQFALIGQDVTLLQKPPAETRFSFASFLRMMPPQFPIIRHLRPGPNPSRFVDPAEADLPPPTAASLLHVQLQGIDCTVKYGERPSSACALTRWGPREVVVAVSGDYLHQPENMVQVTLRPTAGDGDWSYTPTHFPPYSPLLLAVRRKNIGAVQTLLGQGVSPNGHPSGLDAPLAMAVRQRNLDIANVLVDHGADVNVQDSDFGPVLELAAGYGEEADHAGWFDLVKKLIARGADVNRAGPNGPTPLIAATSARDPDPDMIELLLDSGANVNAAETIPFLAFFGLRMPTTAYDLAQFKLDQDTKTGTKADWGGPDLVPRLRKIIRILAQHSAKSGSLRKPGNN